MIYPTLTLLEELGHVTVAAGDGAKKLHTITPEGQAYLESYRPAVDVLLARMAEASRTHGGGPAPQILRAMENLKLEALWDEPKTTFKTLSQKFAENARERCRPISCRRKARDF